MLIPLILLSKFLNGNEKNISRASVAIAFILWLVGVIKHAVVSVVTSFGAMLEAINIEPLTGVNLSGLPYIGYINAFFPLSEALGLLAIYLTAWGIVIVFRWTKSFVPTIGN